MEDQLSRALHEAPETHLHPAPDAVDHHTEQTRAVPDVLDDVVRQALAAFDLPFFDAGSESDREPVVKVGLAEAGTVHISAERSDPPYRADLTLYMRTDLEPDNTGHCHVQGRCELSRNVAHAAPLHHDFALGLHIADDGSLTLDIDQLRAELAQAIRTFG